MKVKIRSQTFGTGIVPRDHRLKPFTGRIIMGIESQVSYPFEAGRCYQVFGEASYKRWVESARVTTIYVERPLRWYHRLLNCLGAEYGEVKVIHLDSMEGNLSRNGDGGTTDACGDRSLYLQKYRLYVKLTEIGILNVASSDLKTLGVELKGEVRLENW